MMRNALEKPRPVRLHMPMDLGHLIINCQELILQAGEARRGAKLCDVLLNLPWAVVLKSICAPRLFMF